MTVTRTTTWVDGNTLTASALNGEFNNLLNAPAIVNADVSGSAGIAESKIAFSGTGHGHTGGTDGKKISGNIQSISSSTSIVNVSNGTSTDSIAFSVTFTPSAIANIVVIANMNWYNGNSAGKNFGDIQLDGAIQGANNLMETDFTAANTAQTTAGTMYITSVSAAAHTITVQYRTNGTGNAVIQAGSLVVMIFNQ